MDMLHGQLSMRTTSSNTSLQLLVLELTLQLLGLGHLTNCFVEVILVDGISVVLDGEQTPDSS
jgi:hypothetical protein